MKSLRNILVELEMNRRIKCGSLDSVLLKSVKDTWVSIENQSETEFLLLFFIYSLFKSDLFGEEFAIAPAPERALTQSNSKYTERKVYY